MSHAAARAPGTALETPADGSRQCGKVQVRVAYLINQYPKVTHTFVRTEIAAVEQAGLAIERVAIRRADAPLLDVADREEEPRTRVILDGGARELTAACLLAAWQTPARFARAFVMALRVGWGSARGVPLHLVYLAEACVLLRWSRARRLDHVHATFGSNPATVAMLCHALGGPPFSFTAHGPEEFDRAALLSIPEKIARAAFVVAVSEAGRAGLQRMCSPAAWARIHVVRCGIDACFHRHGATPIPPARRLVYVGRLCAEKAPLLLIDAVAQLHAAGERCDLVMVGDGPLRPAVESRVDALRLRAYVTLTGWAGRDEVQRHMLAARALVLPSLAEGLPIVLMEALALGRPVICTDVGGVTELVESGVCGYVIPPASPEALAGAIAKVLNATSAELEQMGRHGAARVAQQHDAAAAGRALAALFRARAAAPADG